MQLSTRYVVRGLIEVCSAFEDTDQSAEPTLHRAPRTSYSNSIHRKEHPNGKRRPPFTERQDLSGDAWRDETESQQGPEAQETRAAAGGAGSVLARLVILPHPDHGTSTSSRPGARLLGATVRVQAAPPGEGRGRQATVHHSGRRRNAADSRGCVVHCGARAHARWQGGAGVSAAVASGDQALSFARK